MAKTDMPEKEERVMHRRASFLRTMNAVMWSFFGVRKSSEYERDAEQLNPVHVILAGVLGAVVFVVILILIVRQVVR